MIESSREKPGDGIGTAFQQVQKPETMDAGRLISISTMSDCAPGLLVRHDGKATPRHVAAIGLRTVASFVTVNAGTPLNRSFAQIRNPVARKNVAALAEVFVWEVAASLHNAKNINRAKLELRT